METNNKINNLESNADISQKGEKILDCNKLKRFRIQEYLVYNISLLIFMLLVNGIQYTGLSIRLMLVIPIIFLLVLSIMKNKIKILYYSFFSFLEDLEYYEQQKLMTNQNKKHRRSDRVITVILVLALIFVVIYPSPNLFSLKSIIAALVGLNIGKYLYNHKINNM